MNGKAIMTRADSKVVWIKQIPDSSLNNERRETTLNALHSQPELMREQMDLAAHNVVLRLVHHLAGRTTRAPIRQVTSNR